MKMQTHGFAPLPSWIFRGIPNCQLCNYRFLFQCPDTKVVWEYLQNFLEIAPLWNSYSSSRQASFNWSLLQQQTLIPRPRKCTSISMVFNLNGTTRHFFIDPYCSSLCNLNGITRHFWLTLAAAAYTVWSIRKVRNASVSKHPYLCSKCLALVKSFLLWSR